jgi:hypothetical protein
MMYYELGIEGNIPEFILGFGVKVCVHVVYLLQQHCMCCSLVHGTLFSLLPMFSPSG